MGLIDVKTALKVPGRLCYGSSLDFSAAFPHSGTALGMVLASTVRHSETVAPVRVEDFGVSTEIVDLVEAGERWVFSCALRGSDAAALGVVFKNTITGSSSGEPVILHPGARGEGVLRSVSRSIGLLFSPLDPRHPAVYFPQALPMLEGERELVLHRTKERVILAGFVATRAVTTAGGAVQVGLLEDLVELTP